MALCPGDALGVLPENDPATVAALLLRLRLDGAAAFRLLPAGAAAAEQPQPDTVPQPQAGAAQQPHQEAAAASRLLPHVHCPCTVAAALARCVDLTSPPRRSLLRALAEHCADAAEARELLFLCSRSGKAALEQLLAQQAGFDSHRSPTARQARIFALSLFAAGRARSADARLSCAQRQSVCLIKSPKPSAGRSEPPSRTCTLTQ